MAAWIWNGPGRFRRRQARTSDCPSSISARSHRDRSWSAKKDDRAVSAGPRRLTGVCEQEQREQTNGLRLVGHQLGEQTGEPDPLGAEIGADQLVSARRGVALVVDQVDHRQDRAESFGEVGIPGHSIRDVGGLDLPLGPHQPLGHGRLRDQEGTCDLRSLQPTQQAQGQRHLRRALQRRVTTGEHEPETIVAHRALDRIRLRLSLEQHGPGHDGPLSSTRVADDRSLDCGLW